MASFKVGYTKQKYQHHLLYLSSALLQKQLLKQKQQPIRSGVLQQAKLLIFIYIFTTYFKSNYDLPENTDIHHTEINFNKRNVVV